MYIYVSSASDSIVASRSAPMNKEASGKYESSKGIPCYAESGPCWQDSMYTYFEGSARICLLRRRSTCGRNSIRKRLTVLLSLLVGEVSAAVDD